MKYCAVSCCETTLRYGSPLRQPSCMGETEAFKLDHNESGWRTLHQDIPKFGREDTHQNLKTITVGGGAIFAHIGSVLIYMMSAKAHCAAIWAAIKLFLYARIYEIFFFGFILW